MIIYLIRHAVAVERGTASYPNDDRPLTEDGKDKMSKAARGIVEIVGDVDLILSSPLIRAHDTAKIVARALGAEHKLENCRELIPGSSLKNLISFLTKYKGLKSIMLVGHQPDLGYVASALLGSNESIIEFKKGAICAVEISSLSPRSKGVLLWHLQPKQLRALA
jgi:phosphohistidine phosphatase